MIGTTISSNGDSVEYKGSSKYLDTQTSLTVFRDPPRGTWLPKRYLLLEIHPIQTSLNFIYRTDFSVSLKWCNMLEIDYVFISEEGCDRATPFFRSYFEFEGLRAEQL